MYAAERAGRSRGSMSHLSRLMLPERQILAMCEHALASYGRLDILFNNAGVGGAIGPLTETSVEDGITRLMFWRREYFLA